MQKRISILLIFPLLWFIFSGLNPIDNEELPIKKIHKAIEKIWQVEDYELVDFTSHKDIQCNDRGCWFNVVSNGSSLGTVYVGRVNSCRSGGCSIDPFDEEKLSFEYFDYFFLADTEGVIKWVKVYNYQATQGHEVMSRGWLNQFKGLSVQSSFQIGEDIEAISGATVSAVAITVDINEILSCTSTN